MNARDPRRREVHKFGGTSVADAEGIRRVAGRIRDARVEAEIVVVSSATATTTDDLHALARGACSGDERSVRAAVERIVERHRAIQTQLGSPSVGTTTQTEALLSEITALASALRVTREVSAQVRDRLVAIGEKIAVGLVAQALVDAGVPAEPQFADDFIHTDANFGEARVLIGVTDRRIRAVLEPVLARGGVPVVTGYCGRAPSGATTTLGRGGSDLTATLLAAALDADEVTLWTDVDGVFTADPRRVPGARIIRHLNYREAAELSFYGAQVLHPRTMIPAQSKGIPVRSRNSWNPADPGTVVDTRFTPGSHPVKAVSAIDGHALLSIEGKGMAGVPGVSARAFSALAARSISATMISQASSESSICIALPRERAEEAAAALRDAFRRELSRGQIEEIAVQRDVALAAVVGLGMAHSPGVAARAMTACARQDVNILAIAQGSSELNITLAIDEADVDRAVRALHDGFDLHRADTGVDDGTGLNLILVGVGQIGQALLSLLQARTPHIKDRFGLTPRVVGLIDRSGYVLAPAGLPGDRIEKLIAMKAASRGLSEAPGGTTGSAQAGLTAALDYRLTRPIVVDVSDADDGDQLFIEAFGRGCDVVTANKKPLTGPHDRFDALRRAADREGRQLKAEATVGAGLPIIDTVEVLLGTGDRLASVQGCLSGTLGFVTSELDQGRSFSRAVAEARTRGYCEPDPAIDLSGTDVARKALILARWAGLTGPQGTVESELEGLVDVQWTGLSWPVLEERLRTLDDPYRARVLAASERGEVLRYLATVEPGRVRVGLQSVSAGSPAGRLSGTENLVMFRSDRYDAVPLVVTGPGAGVEVTAMGVLADILRVAAERRGL